jgi:hypothetical protein
VYDTRYAGYIVLNKAVRKNKKKVCSVCGHDGSGKAHRTCPAEDADGKRCGGTWNEEIDPEIFTQVIIDEIPERLEEIVLENTNMINACIKNEIFPRSLTSCNATYGKCPYYELCFKNSEKGLLYKVDKPK